jgi:hypothetical protein
MIGLSPAPLLQCLDMADWRQIQARIRKAKNASDPLPKLTELYQRTRDAMVAWELGAIQEKAELKEQAAHWYTIAAQRFRRADWKKKAEEALTRLGVELPLPSAESEPGEHAMGTHPDEQKSYDASEASHSDEKIESAVRQPESHEHSENTLPLALGEIPEETQPGSALPSTAGSSVNAGTNAAGIAADAEKKKRRRGRRGGRGRRRKGANGAPGLPTQAYAESAESQGAGRPPAQLRAPSMLPAEGADSLYEPRRGATPHAPTHTPMHAPSRGGAASHAASTSQSTSHVGSSQASSESATARRFMPPEADLADTNRPDAPRPGRADSSERISSIDAPPAQLPSERAAHGRAGNPALASRMAQLESMLRRLLGSPLHRLDEADEAPAGPGVFLLSDADQITTYYVEACQTLRIGLGNLARGGGRTQKGRPGAGGGRGYSESGLKAKLAEYLGINEAKVSQYLKDHCVVRWVQLDEDAPHLAHFSVAVLRTPLNVE